MVDLPPDYVIESTLKIGTVYKFTAPELIETEIPHYFIIIAIDGDNNYLVLCTTNKEGKEEYFINAGLDFTGLVYIKPDENNGLKDYTYVNCNDYHIISKSSLIFKFSEGILDYIGYISLNHYSQIRKGIKQSYISDLPHYLLKHPELSDSE